MSHTVLVKTYSLRMDADLAKAILESNGVQAIIAADDAGGMEPWLRSAQQFRVLVRQEDATVARRLLAEPSKPSA